MTLFIWKFLYIGTISQLLIPVTASSQFNTDFTLSALGDSPTTQQAATNPLNPAPDTLPDDAQWTSQPQQNLDLLTQPQALENDKDAFDPSLIALSPIDTQIADPKSSPTTGSCAAKANLKPGASRLLRRAYGEFKPCCDPVNLGLEGPFSWIWGRNTIEDRFPYCCQGGGIEYAAKRLCVPCTYNPFSLSPFPHPNSHTS